VSRGTVPRRVPWDTDQKTWDTWDDWDAEDELNHGSGDDQDSTAAYLAEFLHMQGESRQCPKKMKPWRKNSIYATGTRKSLDDELCEIKRRHDGK
jgi:hypothetical protein